MESKPSEQPLRYVVTILVAVITTVITTAIQNEPDTSNGDASAFLQRYYDGVTDPGQQYKLWEEGQTETFRSFRNRDFNHFQTFFSAYSDVDVLRVAPVSGAPGQFATRLRYTSKKSGRVNDRDYVFTLVCGNWLARLPIITCGPDKLRVDIVQAVPLETAPKG